MVKVNMPYYWHRQYDKWRQRDTWQHEEVTRVTQFRHFRAELDRYGNDTWHCTDVTRGSPYVTWPNDRMTRGSTYDRWLYRCWRGRVTWQYGCWRGISLGRWLLSTGADVERQVVVRQWRGNWPCMLTGLLTVPYGPITGCHEAPRIFPMLARPKNSVATPSGSNPRPLHGKRTTPNVLATWATMFLF